MRLLASTCVVLAVLATPSVAFGGGADCSTAADGGKQLHIFCMHGSYEDEPAADSPPPSRSETLLTAATEHKTQLVAGAGFSLSGLLGLWYLRLRRGPRRL